MPQLKVAVITDGDAVQAFGLEAINALGNCSEITIFACTNTRFKRRLWTHLAYYALNGVSIRNRLTRYVPLSKCAKRLAATIEFESEYHGNWQILPAEIISQLAPFDVVIKLGMGLLTIPSRASLQTPILSFHHGDPSRYRGRPAGFWETWEDADAIGQIVQILSNKLDAGQVVAFAETKVFPHSYRKTLLEAYRHTPLLINKAVRNALAGNGLPISPTGRNFRLPSNLQVARFAMRIAARFVRRLVYGALLEKKWQVSLAPKALASTADLVEAGRFPAAGTWETLSVPPTYNFYADPFISAQPPGILVEALRRSTGLGELVLVQGSVHSRISSAEGHHSYPSTIELGGSQLIVPEIAQWSTPLAFSLAGTELAEVGPLDVEDGGGILDPTLVLHEGRLYLFGNRVSQGSNALYIWSAETITGRFALHPESPVRITPRGSRMGGGFVCEGGRLFRFGQNFLAGYGDGLFLFEIEDLSPGRFEERCLGEIRFPDRSGPHTLNFDENRMVFDWYRNRFSPLAGIRRLLGHVRGRQRSKQLPVK